MKINTLEIQIIPVMITDHQLSLATRHNKLNEEFMVEPEILTMSLQDIKSLKILNSIFNVQIDHMPHIVKLSKKKMELNVIRYDAGLIHRKNLPTKIIDIGNIPLDDIETMKSKVPRTFSLYCEIETYDGKFYYLDESKTTYASHVLTNILNIYQEERAV